MSGYEFYESSELTVASVVPNPYTRLNQGCMLVLPNSVRDQTKHNKILLLKNRSDEIIPQTLVDLLSPESENRFPAAAYLHDRLAMGKNGDREIKIVYFPQETPFSEANGRTIRIETALISVLGFEPIRDPTTMVYHQGRVIMSVNGIGDETDVVTDEVSLNLLYDKLKAILQVPLALVKASSFRHTRNGSFRYLVEPSQLFSNVY